MFEHIRTTPEINYCLPNYKNPLVFKVFPGIRDDGTTTPFRNTDAPLDVGDWLHYAGGFVRGAGIDKKVSFLISPQEYQIKDRSNNPWFRFYKMIQDRSRDGDTACAALLKGSDSGNGGDAQGAAAPWSRRAFAVQGMDMVSGGVSNLQQPKGRSILILTEASSKAASFDLTAMLRDILSQEVQVPTGSSLEDRYVIGSLLAPVNGLVLQAKRLGFPDGIQTVKSNTSGQYRAQSQPGLGWDLSFLPDPFQGFDYSPLWAGNYIPWDQAFRYSSRQELVELLCAAYPPLLTMYAFQGSSELEPMVPQPVLNMWARERSFVGGGNPQMSVGQPKFGGQQSFGNPPPRQNSSAPLFGSVPAQNPGPPQQQTPASLPQPPVDPQASVAPQAPRQPASTFPPQPAATFPPQPAVAPQPTRPGVNLAALRAAAENHRRSAPPYESE